MHYSHVLLDMNSTFQYQGNSKCFTLVRKELNKELKRNSSPTLESTQYTHLWLHIYYAVDDFWSEFWFGSWLLPPLQLPKPNADILTVFDK